MKRLVLALLVLAGCEKASASGDLKAGDVAPAFEVVDQSGGKVSLAQLKGQAVVLYSYPKDDTPGCTVEAKAFSAAQQRMRELGAVVLGVSAQDADSHQAFRAKYNLEFPLLVDKDATLMKAYGMWNGMMARRMTFLINPEGRIHRVWRDVQVQGHDAEVLAALEEMMKARAPARK